MAVRRQRAPTAEERAALEAAAAGDPSLRGRRIGEFVALWAGPMLAFVLLWAAASWALRRYAGAHVGWGSEAAPWLLAGAAVASAVYAARVVARLSRAAGSARAEFAADLRAGVVDEDILEIRDVKRGQEPEHGGLIWFLRTSDDRVYVLYDPESQARGAAGGDPLASGLQPRTQLAVARGVVSGESCGESFSGEPLPVPDPFELVARPEDWPESTTYVDVAWQDVERRFGARPRRRSA